MVQACPLCGSNEESCSERLQLQAYWLGDELIPLPPQGITFIRCQTCNLLYKDVLPSPAFLAEVFARQGGKIWTDDYNFEDEARLVHQLTEGEPFVV
jgi:hypothetical protein